MTADSPTADSAEEAQLIASLEHEADNLWKQSPLLSAATLTIPLWLTLLVLTVVWAVAGTDLIQRLLLAAAASLAAGRFVIWAADSQTGGPGFSALQLAGLVLYLDLIWAVVLTWHAGLLFHLPWVGRRLQSAVHEGSRLLQQNRWMKRLTVMAVLLFVMLPVSSTGSIGGSLLGRLLGLSRLTTLVTVLLGSLAGGAVMLLGARLLQPWMDHLPPGIRYGGIALIVLGGAVMVTRYRAALTD